MPIIAPADLNNQMYPEIQAIITRNDGGILATKAISTAIDTVKMYLTRYDLVQLFGDDDADPPVVATFASPKLNELVITLAVWQLLRLANPTVDLTLSRTWYEDAIHTLEKIQAGKANPQGWPYQNTIGETAPQGDAIYSRSNPRRPTHY